MYKGKGPSTAIIDTSVLLSLYYLDLLKFLNLIYNEVRIPREVEREFLVKNKNSEEQSNRFEYITGFYKNHGSWFFQCNEYGEDLVQIYLTEKELDKGEAEVFAQNQALGSSHELLLDERSGRKVAQRESIIHHGVLYILASLDLKLKICDYYLTVATLKEMNIGRFSDKIIDNVYRYVKSDLGLA
jgi:predicted nucleic acid-binding protein